VLPFQVGLVGLLQNYLCKEGAMSRVIVTIHGTGRTARNFWVPQIEALASHLGAPPRHRAVWWGDMADTGNRLFRLGMRLSTALYRLAGILGSPLYFLGRLVWRAADLLYRLLSSIAGAIAYLFLPGRRATIRERLRQTLAELTRHNHEIILVSESLGCLVAFDVLRKEAHRFNIAAWITLGCPLNLLIRTGMRNPDLGAINPRTVRRWLNLYCPRDLVAAPVSPVFPTYPVRDERVDGPWGRLQAHRYWNNPQVLAIIARELRSSLHS